jgi:peptidoglycan/xylan/chitin deacetylase (PgdA/CDA1 family)
VSVPASALISTAANGLHRAGMLSAVSRLSGWIGRQPAFQILTYHRVNDDCDPFFPALPVAVFEAQVRHVARSYTVLGVEALAERMRRRSVPRDALAITFDDGYRDNLRCAAPVIAQHGLCATIFLATAYIGARSRPWFDQVALAFKTTQAERATLPWGTRIELRDQAARLAALQQSWAYLKRVREEAFDDTLAGLVAALEPFSPPAARDGGNDMLDWDEVRTLSRMGFSIGSHTATHPILSMVAAGRVRRELSESRDAIEAAIGRLPQAFAYPNGSPGDYTAETVHMVRDAGFTCAVTCRFGVNTCATSPWELRRGGPWEHDLPTFALKLAGYRVARTT